MKLDQVMTISLFPRQSWTNIWNEVRKSSKIRQGYKAWISALASFLNAIAKVQFRSA